MHKERWTYGKFNSHEPFSNGVRGNDQSDIFRTINPRSDSKQQLATDDVNSQRGKGFQHDQNAVFKGMPPDEEARGTKKIEGVLKNEMTEEDALR